MSESIYLRALGADFDRLHPLIQRRFGFSSGDRVAAIGRGVMDELWHGPPYTLPFLYAGTWRRIMFPEPGRNVPFTIENYAYRDPLGRETVSWLRTFRTRRVRRFDAYMIYGEQRLPDRRLPRVASAPGGGHRPRGGRARRAPLAFGRAALL